MVTALYWKTEVHRPGHPICFREEVQISQRAQTEKQRGTKNSLRGVKALESATVVAVKTVCPLSLLLLRVRNFVCIIYDMYTLVYRT
jgi:hypothetical protein